MSTSSHRTNHAVSAIGTILLTVAITAAIGLLMSLPLPRVFEAMFVDTHVDEPRLYFLVPLVIVAVATLAMYVPARWAARVDPIDALRQE